MEDSASPMVLRRRLRIELLAARDEQKLTQRKVARAMDWSLSKINRIETGKTGISTNDLRALLQLYGIADPEREDHLLSLAREARQDRWWASYSDVASRELQELMEYESASSTIRQFETTFVPGIVQTEDYASTVLHVFHRDKSDEQVKRLVELRTSRAQLLTRENAPDFYFILDESVIRRQVGSPSIMRQQLQDLIRVSKLPNVHIQVIPFEAGMHRGMTGAFEVIQFGDPRDIDAVFVEGPQDFFVEDLEGIRRYPEIFGQIANLARGPEETVKLLESASNQA
jgi:transcriptional regulator with XRE-family HTH domain